MFLKGAQFLSPCGGDRRADHSAALAGGLSLKSSFILNQEKEQIMSGWKTWLSAILGVGGAVLQGSNGDVVGAVQTGMAALAVVGIGHKIEKNGRF